MRELLAVPSALSVGSPYPHPVVRGEVSHIPIEFGTTTHRVLRVTLANMLGQTIQNIAFTASDAASAEVRWLVPGIAPGVYILRVQAGDAVTVRPVVVNR
ncbi:MAG: T9SS type A sorting domain-containing protein [Bacteroidia bacterium]|nr:T9SS type A sorting domain-containing protein [Bacteroidia bacterium]